MTPTSSPRRLGSALRCLTSLLVTFGPAAGLPSLLHAAEAPSVRQIELGLEARVRTENWDNLADFSDATIDTRHQVRYRARAWGRLTLPGRLEAMLGVNNESRRITTPDTPFRRDETIVETLYLDYRFSPSLSARLGRQNLVRGDGFLVLDGTPLDGSRTNYFNALAVSLARGRRRLELLVISNPSRDQYLPRIDSAGKLLVDWDERAIGLGWYDTHRDDQTLDLYLFQKIERSDYRGPDYPRRHDRNVATLGGRWTRKFTGGWSLLGEAAGQVGTADAPDREILAWGGQASVKRTLDLPWHPSLLLGVTDLSGDNPKTDRIEGWDPIFSRWPKWSELYLYTLGSEQGVAWWTNIALWQAEVQASPSRRLNFRGTVYHMTAFHPFPGRAAVYAGGTTRGNLFEVRADFKANDYLRGHLLGEYMAPGDFYVGSDGAWFLRAEVIASFQKVLGL